MRCEIHRKYLITERGNYYEQEDFCNSRSMRNGYDSLRSGS